MIATVTTSTVSTVTSATSAVSSATTTTAAIALNASLALGLVLIVTLLVFLIQKEILAASTGPRVQAMSRVLDVAIAPLLLSFCLIAAFSIFQVLR